MRLRLPVRILDRDEVAQNTLGRFRVETSLTPNLSEQHHARILEELGRRQSGMSIQSFPGLLSAMRSALGCELLRIEVGFAYFRQKHAPVSGARSLLDYGVSFMGESCNDCDTLRVKVDVPVTSVCPCSKSISDYGAHNQRSLVSVTASVTATMWIDELIDIVEDESSCELYGLLKRADEKYVTEHAYDNPKFVEDIVRDIALRLNDDPRVSEFVVESENFESIHNHSAYARVDSKSI